MNFEAHGLRYIRTARKGTCECIAIRGGRSGKPEGFSNSERSDCDTFARRGRVRSKRPHTFALFLSSMSRKSSTFALFWPRRARKNTRPSHFPGLDEQKFVCMRSFKHPEPPPSYSDQFHQQTLLLKKTLCGNFGEETLRGAVSSAFSQEGPCLNTFSDRGGGFRNQA